MKNSKFIALFAFVLLAFAIYPPSAPASDLTQKPRSCKQLRCDIKNAYVCGKIQVGHRTLDYCYLSPSRFEKSQRLWTEVSFDLTQPIRPLIHLHGAGASDLSKWWNLFYYLTWNQLELTQKTPLPILVSFGPSWLLSRDSNYYSVDDLVQIAFPKIIEHIRKTEPDIQLDEQFSLIGESMGGHNSLQIYLSHPEKIAAAAVFCTAVIELSPFASEKEILEYIERTGAVPQVARSIPVIAKSSYANPQHYAKDQLLNPHRMRGPFPPLWAHYDDGDEFGFDKTNPNFFKMLGEKNAKFELLHEPGRHCEGARRHYSTAYSFLNR